MNDRITPFFQGQLSLPSRILLVAVAAALLPAIFAPIWRITLHAPQYPEGLSVHIYSHTVKGDVQEVNELNHYIGMKPIRADDFGEFRFVPFFILRFFAFAALAALVARLPVAAIGYIDFIVFGAVMLVDFQQWLSDYGMELDPRAPIHLDPFKPRFLGTTQVGQFHVTSYPDWGAVVMFLAGLAGPAILAYEWWRRRGEA